MAGSEALESGLLRSVLRVERWFFFGCGGFLSYLKDSAWMEDGTVMQVSIAVASVPASGSQEGMHCLVSGRSKSHENMSRVLIILPMDKRHARLKLMIMMMG